ncbi:hypothetical protein CPB84DRAFT_1753339 [Gymnopilus junonius]|uniref:Uncharacterized protein n=1 Tax=Gymnopilus junonius TaxID=109634 RepID=A0A9P5TGT4_GYMJU|nr:hypothetical protein CPB84DRAFT_1753339 [Gymnopilus junonius]
MRVTNSTLRDAFVTQSHRSKAKPLRRNFDFSRTAGNSEGDRRLLNHRRGLLEGFKTRILTWIGADGGGCRYDVYLGLQVDAQDILKHENREKEKRRTLKREQEAKCEEEEEAIRVAGAEYGDESTTINSDSKGSLSEWSAHSSCGPKFQGSRSPARRVMRLHASKIQLEFPISPTVGII